LLKEWDYEKNKKVDPENVFPGYSKHVWWNCGKCGDSWRSYLRSRTFGNAQCKKCCPGSRGEERVRVVLEDIGVEYKKEWVLKPTRLRADFYVPSSNLIIEYDGSQHFQQKFFQSFSEIQRRDILKNNYCKERGISLLRISYKDTRLIESLLKRVLSRDDHFIDFSPSYHMMSYNS
jgi:very-short-patch-repair endonuclease